MSAIILDGKQIAKEIYSTISLNSEPSVVFLLVGDDKNSIKYLTSKIKKARSLGFNPSLKTLDSNINQKDLEKKLEKLSKDSDINGVLLQLPLPKHLSSLEAVKKINPLKDIDGLHPNNYFALANKEAGIIPCTALGVLELIKYACVELKKELLGLDVVVLGRSYLVGKPIAQLLENQGCTVSVCHSQTKNLEKYLLTSDIVVSATGKKNLISKVKPDSIVIDVGINYESGGLCGDVNFDVVSKNCAAISPVPGGVGPLTIAMLMKNIVKACRLQGL